MKMIAKNHLLFVVQRSCALLLHYTIALTKRQDIPTRLRFCAKQKTLCERLVPIAF